MSGTTPTFALPYPTDGDLVQLVDESIQSLAEGVEAALLGTAWTNLTLPGTSTIIAAGTWGTPGVRRMGGMVRGRGLISSSAAIGVGTLLATIPTASLRPVISHRITTQLASSGGGPQVGVVTVAPDGTIKIDAYSSAGTTLAMSFAFDFPLV